MAGQCANEIQFSQTRVGVASRDNNICILCILAYAISGCDGSQITRTDYVRCGPNGRALDDACRYFSESRSLVSELCTVRMSLEELHKPVVGVIWDCKICKLFRQGVVTNSIKCFDRNLYPSFSLGCFLSYLSLSFRAKMIKVFIIGYYILWHSSRLYPPFFVTSPPQHSYILTYLKTRR